MIKVLISEVTKIGAEVGFKVFKHIKETTKLSIAEATKSAGKKLKESIKKWKDSMSVANKEFADSVKNIVKESAVDVKLNEDEVFSLQNGKVKLNMKAFENYISNVLSYTIDTTINVVLSKLNLSNTSEREFAMAS